MPNTILQQVTELPHTLQNAKTWQKVKPLITPLPYTGKTLVNAINTAIAKQQFKIID